VTAYAFLHLPVLCPSCATPVHDELWFQWGFCRGRAPHPDSTYKVGDEIRWKRCSDGTTPAWTYFSSGGGNIGTPELRDLVVRDSGQTWLREPCNHCATPLDGGAVEIRSGRILRGWLALPDEFPIAGADYWTVTEEGVGEPLDLDDHPMGMTDCDVAGRR
jgi:hypothetical protein